MAKDRQGPFWDFIEGRAEAPPAARLLGWELRSIDPEAGKIQVDFTARAEFLNPAGAIQGGFLAAMLDDTLGPALVATLDPDQWAPTLELKISFLRPAAPGLLTGSGRVVHRGGGVAFLEGDLRDVDGRVLATATSTTRIVRTERPA